VYIERQDVCVYDIPDLKKKRFSSFCIFNIFHICFPFFMIMSKTVCHRHNATTLFREPCFFVKQGEVQKFYISLPKVKRLFRNKINVMFKRKCLCV